MTATAEELLTIRSCVLEVLEALSEREFEIGSHRSPDPNDDYLLALAEAERAVLVTGDAHLLALAPQLPILTARGFVESL